MALTSCTLPWVTPDTSVVSSEISATIYQQSIDPDTKVDLAKKRKQYIAWIRKWDYYSLRNNPEEALSYYLSIAERIPTDQIIRKKIAHVYFLQKNWKSAYASYIQVPVTELTESEQHEMFQSLFFDDSQIDRIGEIQKIPSSTGSREYYRVIDMCYTGIHNCIITLEWYSGSSFEILDLRTSIRNATAISPDFQYRNLSVAAQFFGLGMYGVSARLAEEILKVRPDYYEVQKLLGFSYAELWKYPEAKKYLLEYTENIPKDLETMRRIWEVYAHLGESISSNLYLNNAIIEGYSPKTDLERQLAYNYSLLGDMPALMKVMNYLLQEQDAREDDFAVGISMALWEWELKRAQMWADASLKQFPGSRMLIPLVIETYRLTGNRDAAQTLLEHEDATVYAENPNFLLQKWIFLFEQARYDESKKILESLWDRDEWPEVAEEARAYLQSIEKNTSTSDTLF